MSVRITGFRYTDRFSKELNAASTEVQQAFKEVARGLLQQPAPRALRLHPLRGFSKPTIWKVDVFTNHSWQVTFEVDGTVAILVRIASHREIDRRPR